jgi:hypothetical protein
MDKDRGIHSIDEGFVSSNDPQRDNVNIDRVDHHRENTRLECDSAHKYRDRDDHGNRDEWNNQRRSGDIELVKNLEGRRRRVTSSMREKSVRIVTVGEGSKMFASIK